MESCLRLSHRDAFGNRGKAVPAPFESVVSMDLRYQISGTSCETFQIQLLTVHCRINLATYLRS